LKRRIEWDSVAHHKAHLGTDLEKEITGIIWPLIDASRPLITSHIPLDPSVHRAIFEAPIVGICTYRNVQNIPAFEERITMFNDEARQLEVYQGMVSGWKLEEDHRKEFAAVIGWSSVEDHIKAAAKSPLVEQMESVSKLTGDIESHHVILKQWIA